MEIGVDLNTLSDEFLAGLLDKQILLLRGLIPVYSIAYPVSLAKYRQIYNYDEGKASFINDINRTMRILEMRKICDYDLCELRRVAGILINIINDIEAAEVLNALLNLINTEEQ